MQVGRPRNDTDKEYTMVVVAGIDVSKVSLEVDDGPAKRFDNSTDGIPWRMAEGAGRLPVCRV